MKIGIYPGSFDPITMGHLDIIKRSSKLFDKLIVAVFINSSKIPMFTIKERMEFLEESTKDIGNVEIKSCEGLLVEYAKTMGATTIVRGLRAITDFEYELQMAQTNYKLCDIIETIFMATKLEYAYLSSSMVKEVAKFNGNIKGFVPEQILEKVEKKLKGASYGCY